MNSESLRTDRLELMIPTVKDAAAIFVIAGDQRTVRHNPSDLLADVAEARELVGRWVQHWRNRSFGYWCVREAGQAEVVGYCGVKSMIVHGGPALNLIYRFTPGVWGRGYATEAAAAVVSWIAEHQPDATIIARVRPDNWASRNVAVKVGLCQTTPWDEVGEDGLDLAYTNRHWDGRGRTTPPGGMETDQCTRRREDHRSGPCGRR